MHFFAEARMVSPQNGQAFVGPAAGSAGGGAAMAPQTEHAVEMSFRSIPQPGHFGICSSFFLSNVTPHRIPNPPRVRNTVKAIVRRPKFNCTIRSGPRYSQLFRFSICRSVTGPPDCRMTSPPPRIICRLSRRDPNPLPFTACVVVALPGYGKRPS